MDVLWIICLVIFCVLIGVVSTIVIEWYFFNYYIMSKPFVGPPDKPMTAGYSLPQKLLDVLQNKDLPKKESCIALNLIFQFLFKELRNTDKVRKWFIRKLSLEFEELLTKTTTGKLFDNVTIRDLCLGTQFPVIKGVTVVNVDLHPEHQYIDSLDVSLDVEYSGGFQLAINANMLLGRTAYLSVKVNHLSGLGRLQFARKPCSHWSFSFYNDPALELSVESQFQGRPLSQITSLIINQIRKSLKKKHTLPNFKMRYKPFFTKPDPTEDDQYRTDTACPGTLHVTVIECTRLMESLLAGKIYCSLAVDSTPWVEVVQSDTSSYMTLDLNIMKQPSSQLGIVFKQEFILGKYKHCVTVETVIPNSPAHAADVRKNDILLAVDGKTVTSLNQAAKLLKNAGERFRVRVERIMNHKVPQQEGAKEKDVAEKDSDEVMDKIPVKIPHVDVHRYSEGDASKLSDSGRFSLPGSPVLQRAGLRKRQASGDKTDKESDSSSSGAPSVPGSPSKKPSLFSRPKQSPENSTQSSPEQKRKSIDIPIPLTKNKEHSSSSIDISKSNNGEEEQTSDAAAETLENTIQINKTKEFAPNQDLTFDEAFSFKIEEKHKYLNVSVWSRQPENAVKEESTSKINLKVHRLSDSGIGERPGTPKLPSKPEKDVLLGHISIPVGRIAMECTTTNLGHYIKSYHLLPPDPEATASRSHPFASHSGFEPTMCYGDILLSFMYKTNDGTAPSIKDILQSKEACIVVNKVENDRKEQTAEAERPHDFIRTHFHRATQCEFCRKKIWLKDAVQCRNCAMTCHKKCIQKCQSGTVCTSSGAKRKTSEEQSRTPEIIMTSPDGQLEDGDLGSSEAISDGKQNSCTTPQSHRRGFGSLLASVASAAQSRGLKRAGSANNLAPPASQNQTNLSRSLPPSPQRSPSTSRKASLVGNPFQFSNTVDDDDDDVNLALDHLLQHPNDENLMAAAKASGKELYSGLSLEERKEKINKMISKLKAAIDKETEVRIDLAHQEQEGKDAESRTKIAFLIGKSDEKVQALAILMLHFCAGLQHTQDLEELQKKEADIGVVSLQSDIVN